MSDSSRLFSEPDSKPTEPIAELPKAPAVFSNIKLSSQGGELSPNEELVKLICKVKERIPTLLASFSAPCKSDVSESRSSKRAELKRIDKLLEQRVNEVAPFQPKSK